jgi:hypothetical protein
MGKQHQTIPNEPVEMPAEKERPDIMQPADPHVPEIPQESPDEIPDEVPPEPQQGANNGPVHNG